MSIKINGVEVDSFTHGYLTCALWSSIEELPEGNGGPPLDENFCVEDIAVEALNAAVKECKEFQDANADDLDEYQRLRDEQEGAPKEAGTTWIEYAGHDFWLTRNGHGAGFWDRGIGEVGDRLSEAAHKCGSRDAYVGDDRQVYFS